MFLSATNVCPAVIHLQINKEDTNYVFCSQDAGVQREDQRCYHGHRRQGRRVSAASNVLPFYAFDAPSTNAPKIGVEISDLAMERTAPQAGAKFYAGCTDRGRHGQEGVETMPGASISSASHFEAADPNGAEPLRGGVCGRSPRLLPR
ncbi:MAG: hypothetical protein ACLU9S_13785 [Oscillospiraceae bacterium]